MLGENALDFEAIFYFQCSADYEALHITAKNS